MTKRLVHFTWSDFDRAVADLVPILKQYSCFDGIYGVPRGGLVLAVALSHHLELPLRDSVFERTLVVDDISETGKTLIPFYGSFIATIHYVRGSQVTPNAYALIKDPNDWIVYPWETNKSSEGV